MRTQLYILLIVFIGLTAGVRAYTEVVRNNNRTYIEDRTGEHWDVSQAKTIGFRPEKFQYGIGRYAFRPLDDSHRSEDSNSVPLNQRVIGIGDRETAQAYSVSRLARHEVANSMLGDVPIAVGY